MYSAIVMIALPALTNIYYTFRPNAMFAKISPFAVPIICVSQYFGVLRYEF